MIRRLEIVCFEEEGEGAGYGEARLWGCGGVEGQVDVGCEGVEGGRGRSEGR